MHSNSVNNSEMILPLYQVETRSRVNHVTDLARLELECSLLEFFLHLASAEETEVSRLLGTAIVRLGRSQFTQRYLPAADAGLISKDDAHSLLLGARDFWLHSMYQICLLPSFPKYLMLYSKLTSRQLLGRRLSLCLTSKCLARILPLVPDASDRVWTAPWFSRMYFFSFSTSVPAGGSHWEDFWDSL